jgi:hypothetical protein
MVGGSLVAQELHSRGIDDCAVIRHLEQSAAADVKTFRTLQFDLRFRV